MKVPDINQLKSDIWENRKMIIVLFTLFLLAFTIRAHLMTYDSLFGFDSYYHARIAGDLAEYGTLPQVDPLAYYQEGGSTLPSWTLFWNITAVMYNVFTLGQFSKESWIFFVKVYPALFGALISIAMYWLGKELFSSKKNDSIGKAAGIAMALIAATVPAFVYRTMSGFFEDDSLGFLWMVLAFIFFARAVKSEKITKESIANSLIGGVFMVILFETWAFANVVPVLLAGYAFFAMIIIALENNKERLTAFIANFFSGYLLFNIILLISSGSIGWVETITDYATQFTPDFIDPLIFPILGIGVLIAVGIAYFFSTFKPENKKVIMTLTIVTLLVMPLLMMMLFMTVGDVQDRTTISSMVGEESTGKGYFGEKYNALIIFPFVGLLIPAAIYLFRKKETNTLPLLAFFWILITWTMANYKLQHTYTFGLPIAVAAGFTTYLVLEIIKKYKFGKGIESKIIIISLVFVLLLGVGASAVFVPDKAPYIESNPEWKEAITWISEETPTDAKLFNWWDQGHVISFMTERKVSTDNRNWSFQANLAMANFITTSDVNYAFSIADQNIGADYIVLDSSMFLKEPTYLFYKFNKVDYSNAEIKPFLEGVVRVISCSEQTGGMNCGGTIVTSADFNNIPTKWTSAPSQFVNGKYPIYIYKSKNTLIALNQATNNSNLAKVWFNSDDVNGMYTDVFTNDVVKILKINRG